MDTQHGEHTQPDEISLVDIFVVFIKRRRLLIVSAGLAILLSVLILYILPLFSVYVYDPGTSYTSERIIQLPSIPVDLQHYIQVAPAQRLSVLFSDPAFISSEYETVMEGKNGMSDTAYTSHLRENVLGKQLMFSHDEKQNTVKISFTHMNLQDSQQFLQDVVAKARSRVLREYTQAYSDAQTAVTFATETTTELLAGLENVRQTDIQPLAELRHNIERLRVRMNQNDFPWSVDKPVVYEDDDGTSRSVLLAVIVIAVVFLAVFIAFILEYADRVKNDPEEMQKIHNAWKWKGK